MKHNYRTKPSNCNINRQPTIPLANLVEVGKSSDGAEDQRKRAGIGKAGCAAGRGRGRACACACGRTSAAALEASTRSTGGVPGRGRGCSSGWAAEGRRNQGGVSWESSAGACADGADGANNTWGGGDDDNGSGVGGVGSSQAGERGVVAGDDGLNTLNGARPGDGGGESDSSRCRGRGGSSGRRDGRCVTTAQAELARVVDLVALSDLERVVVAVGERVGWNPGIGAVGRAGYRVVSKHVVKRRA